MKLRSLAAALAAVVVMALAPVAAQAWPAQTTGSLNVRSGPGVGYQKIGVLPRYAHVNVRYCQGSWCAIDYGPYGAWVSARYLTGSGYVQPRYVPAPPPPGYYPYPRTYRPRPPNSGFSLYFRL